MQYIMLKKKILHRYMSGKRFLTPTERFGKKFLPKLNQPYPSPPQKSDGQPHRGWGRSGFNTLVDVIRQQNGWRAFIMSWFLRLKFCNFRLKIRR